MAGNIIPQDRNVLLMRLSLLVVLTIIPTTCHGNSSRRYAAYDYDLTTPQFTPDGRLLQVEYATNACAREGSNPIVSIGITLPDGGDTVLIMATISSPPHSSSSVSFLSPLQTIPSNGGTDDSLDQQHEPEFNSFVKENHRAQFRIVEVPLSASFSQSRHLTILVGLSGLISDATSLLQIIYSQLEQEQRSMGWHRLGLSPIGVNKIVDESGSISASQSSSHLSRRIMYQSIFAQPSETVLRLSRAIADECQKHAFGGGLRPFGASLLIAGVDSCPDMSSKGNTAQSSILGARVSMCETYPNGGCRNSVSSNLQNNSNNSNDRSTSSTRKSSQIMVSGGSLQSQRTLKRMLSSRLHKSNNDGIDESLFLRQVLQTVTISLVDEWQNRGSYSPLSTTTESLEAMQQLLKTGVPQMEIVISSSKRGTHRLTKKDASQLLRFK